MGRIRASTSATVTRSNRSLPETRVTVWLVYNGIPKSSRHWLILRESPLGVGFASYTPNT